MLETHNKQYTSANFITMENLETRLLSALLNYYVEINRAGFYSWNDI